MKIVKIILAGATAITALTSAALAQQPTAAQQPLQGTITKIDRIHGTIGIQQTQSGTVGASAGGGTEEYKVQDRPALDAVHAGDRVTFSTTEGSGGKTITNLKKQ